MAGLPDLSPEHTARCADLLAAMTLDEKLAQLVGLWVMADPQSGEVAPYQGTFVASRSEQPPVAEQMRDGIGQLTRALGSAPVTPADGARLIAGLQRALRDHTRLAIPAIVHEECLTGFMALGATAFPCPLSWGSTWDPELIERVGDTIRDQMRSVGAHQGLAPVLDVVRDARWGRVEECIGEDPYLVGTIGCAYIRGLQGARAGGLSHGVAATAKHFAGYASSEGGRNLAPAHLGARELADVFLIPFEMAVADGVASVMNAYQEIDGVPVAASRELLTGVLRDQWGFGGVVVSDYFSVAYLHALHGVAASNAEAAALALHAGVDQELPSPDCYTEPLREALAVGLVSESDVDRAVERVLGLKARLGLFDGALDGDPAAPPAVAPTADDSLDPPQARALARQVAERSIVLLQNDGEVLPLAPPPRRLAVIGPLADSPTGLLGNYSFVNHVASHFPDAPAGVRVPTIVEAIRAEAGPQVTITHARGCDVLGEATDGFAEAAVAAEAADVAVVVVGDQAGHFGAGTSGEGTDTDDLRLPGVQEDLVLAVAATGTPTVVTLVSGRPYALHVLRERVPAIVQAWLPGEEGGPALAGVLFGRVNPAGRSPVTFGRGAGQQPLSYLHKSLGRTGYARSSTRPVFAFGHGLSYTTFSYGDLELSGSELALDGTLTVSCSLTNTGRRSGSEVAQLYIHDPFASATRPVQELKGYARIDLDPGRSARVTFELPADLLSFTGLDLRRIVEPGRIDLMIGASSADIRLRASVELVGDGPRLVGPGRALTTAVTVSG